MLTELLSYWGAENMRKCSRASLQNISIPPSGKEFLERIGLPFIDDPRFRFEPDGPPFPLIDEANGYRRIGFYDSSPICVKEGEGEVYWYDDENCTSKFMNSSLEAFALLLTMYQQMLVKSRSVAQNQHKTIVSETEQRMQSIDPQAFADENFYWSVVFEEIGYELS